jgi:hypothetical protein
MSVAEARQKNLEDARLAMQNATPEAYPQARIRYFTLKEGQGWLRSEKERLADAEIDPVLRDLEAKYDTNHRVETKSDTESRYLHRRLLEEKDKVGVALRSAELGTSVVQTSWLPYILDMLIAVTGLGCVYLLLSGKASRIMGFFRPTNTI